MHGDGRGRQRSSGMTYVGVAAHYFLGAVRFVFFLHLGLILSRRLSHQRHRRSFVHRINLVFQAGHVIFMPFGSFMTTLGGSLGQVIMPLIATGALAFKNRDNFGASIGLWWCGQSVMDLAPYINDARDLKLMLLGGGTGQDRPGMHDWENILLDLRWIEYDRQIAAATDASEQSCWRLFPGAVTCCIASIGICLVGRSSW
jgi:hypothetical protein